MIQLTVRKLTKEKCYSNVAVSSHNKCRPFSITPFKGNSE